MKQIFKLTMATSATFAPLIGVVSCAKNDPDLPRKLINHQKTILGSQVIDDKDSLGQKGTLTLFKQEKTNNLEQEIKKLFTEQTSFDNQNEILSWDQNFDPTKKGTYTLSLKTNNQIEYQLKVNIIDPQVTEDGFYLLAPFYSGELKNNDLPTTEYNQEIVPIGLNNSWAYEQAVMMQDQDAFFMLYDQDQADQLTINNFIDTVYFEDTSIMSVNSITKLNEAVNNISANENTYIPFQSNQELNTYFGSQLFGVPNIEADFMLNLAKAQTFYANNVLVQDAIFNYYGYQQLKNSQGDFLVDDNVQNPAWKSKPVFQEEPILTYQKVGLNAIKITYHGSDTWAQLGAKMVIKNLNTNTYNEYGSFAFGNEEVWKKYRDNNQAKYVGYQKEV